MSSESKIHKPERRLVKTSGRDPGDELAGADSSRPAGLADRAIVARTGSSGYAAVIFDMDGVVTDTAGVHAAAWKALFDVVLATEDPPGSQLPFDQDEDYRRFVDGRSREDGVRSFLRARGITVAEGTPADTADLLTVTGLAARKQQLFTDQLARRGVQVFGPTVELLKRLRATNVPTAVVTSSRNSRSVLDAGGVTDLFTVRVDGTDADRLSLPGKPDPAMFWEAARQLGVDPGDAVVVEDAVAGVRAAATGGFALVVGVDRTGPGQALLAAGADIVVADLAGLDLNAPRACARSRERQLVWCGGASQARDGWLLVYDQFDPAQEGTRETLCSLGNGYWGTRGSVPGTVAGPVHYPGTYLAGLYNRVRTGLEHKVVETEHRVNVPDWTFLSVRADGGPALLPGCAQMLEHRQELDLRQGVLTRTNRYRDGAGRTTCVTTRQFHSLTRHNVAALELTVEAEDWSGEIDVRTAINGHVANTNVAADSQLSSQHLTAVRSVQVDADTVLLEARTTQSDISIAVAVRTRVREAETVLRLRSDLTDPAEPGQAMTLALTRGQPVRIEKIAVVASSRDRAVSTAALAVCETVTCCPGFAELLSAHVRSWKRLWERFGVRLQASPRQCLALNLHTFHVLQSVAAVDPDLDAGVPARGLHGEGYRGHIFWDELFVYPSLTLRRPELTKALLLYRHRRLGQARAAARSAGLSGAMFPWQSGSDGREETPTELLNVRTGSWMPDNSKRQHHVGLAISYSIWQYYQATGDLGFLAQYGAEVLVEVARLFASLAVYDDAGDRYDITGVMGPDEFHDGYPTTPGQGLRNNAYTNVLTSWVLTQTCAAVRLVEAYDGVTLHGRLRVDSDELAAWERISRRLRVPFHADGVMSQFEGYEQLREFDWDCYRSRYANIERLDLILQAEGDSTNNYRLSKQADVLMLFYLLSAEELRGTLHRLGYALPSQIVPRTIDFYLARTTHGSTLSRLAHSWVLARSDRSRSWSLFTEALEADLSDTQGGTTREGVHLGAMAGTVDMVIRCYAGVETRRDTLWLHPVLPPQLPGLSFQLSYRGQPISVEITQELVRLHLHPCSARPTHVCVEGVKKSLRPGDTYEMTRKA